jgi:hypothetical protein
MASAKVGSPITSCQASTGSWLVISVEPRPYASSWLRLHGPRRDCCQQPAALIVQAVAARQLDFEEVISWKRSPSRVGRLVQPASRNGWLFRSKRDRKIAASIGSAKQ